MARYAAAVFLALLSQLSGAAEQTSALSAMKLLPRQELKSLATIVAHDGMPIPERWHFLVYDPNSPSGVREYVVEKGELVTARGISQFAEKLTTADVINDQMLQIDSDTLAQLAEQYAAANNIAITGITYRLLKDGMPGVPSWRVNCIGPAGKAVGTLVVTATEGHVISHQGFPVQPKIEFDEQDSQKKLTSTRPRPRDPKPASQLTANDPPKKTPTETAKRRVEKRRVVSPAQPNPPNRNRRTQYFSSQPEPVAEARRPRSLGEAFRNLFRRGRSAP